MHYGDLVKSASSIKEAEHIMKEIYQESPDYWPHGLSSKHFDGGLYLIREASTKDPVGFVGWQERNEQMNKIGYYSIGVQKEHRRKGFAKEAVNKIISEKSAGVDIVRALIVEKNKPSISLADSLEEKVQIKKATHDNLGDDWVMPYGQVTDDEAERIEEELPSPWLAGAGGAAGSAGLSALGSLLINHGATPAEKLRVMGLAAAGGGAVGGVLSGLSQNSRNEDLMKVINTARKSASSDKQGLGKEVGDIYDSLVKESFLNKESSVGGVASWLARSAPKSWLTRLGIGAGAGLGVGEMENRAMGFDGGTAHINRLLNAVTFGTGGASKSLKTFGNRDKNPNL